MTSDTHIHKYDWLGFSLKSLMLIFVGIVALGSYIGVLLFGNNSVLILHRLNKNKITLIQKEISLKKENQKLQKEYFEMLQLQE